MSMKPVVGIFAHPDDESFFTGGTIATLAKERDVYTICVTNGEAGENSSGKEGSLADIRKEELLASGKILGIKKTYFLNYKDGKLSNSIYHEVAAKIKEITDEIQPEILLTFEPHGISGHLDHIATSFITSYVFQNASYAKELWYFCNNDDPINVQKEYFIYWPPGYAKEDISKTISVESVWEQKVFAMKQHVSQTKDVNNILAKYPPRPKEENFIILTKDTE